MSGLTEFIKDDDDDDDGSIPCTELLVPFL